MTMSEGLGSMLGAGAEKAGGYIPYIGTAYKVFKGYKAFKKGGAKGLAKSVIPFGGSIFGGGGGSRTNKMARQYMDIVNRFNKEFITPTVSNMKDIKRDIIRGTVRIDGESFRNILKQFEGAGKGLRDLVGRSDFGGVSKRISELSSLSDKLQAELGRGSGGGTGPDISIRPLEGKQQTSAVLRLPGTRGNVYGFSPIQSEAHRFPVKTTITPMTSPGILT